MLIKENNRFKLLFLAYMKSLSSYNSSSYYNGHNCYIPPKHIYFYEWSCLDNGSKHFDSIKDFLDYLSRYDITITNEQKNLIESNNWCYATCVPNKKILLVESQYFKLRNKLEECSKAKSSVTSLIPFYI